MMTPRPPYLAPQIANWKREELFYIVKHGVKFTGMPAWPARERDDEVWAMVAFLEKLPKLDEAAYRRLAYGEPQPAAPMEAMEGAEQVAPADLQTCARCHGGDGIARRKWRFPKPCWPVGPISAKRPGSLCARRSTQRDHAADCRCAKQGIDCQPEPLLFQPPPQRARLPWTRNRRPRSSADDPLLKAVSRISGCRRVWIAMHRRLHVSKPEYPYPGQVSRRTILCCSSSSSRKDTAAVRNTRIMMHAIVPPNDSSEQMRDVALYSALASTPAAPRGESSRQPLSPGPQIPAPPLRFCKNSFDVPLRICVRINLAVFAVSQACRRAALEVTFRTISKPSGLLALVTSLPGTRADYRLPALAMPLS